MKRYRRQLWLNILEDLGPPQGCVLPLWLVVCWSILFPFNALQRLFNGPGPYCPYRMTWLLYGVEIPDKMIIRLANEVREKQRHGALTATTTSANDD